MTRHCLMTQSDLQEGITKMNYSLDIRKHNEKAHLDIEHDIQTKKDGEFTFILKVNNGNIVSYSIIEKIGYGKYAGLEQAIITQLASAYSSQSRGTGASIRRPDNQHQAGKRNGSTEKPIHR